MESQSVVPYPSDLIDPSRKDLKWGLKNFKAMHSEWNGSGSHTFRHRHRQIVTNRLFAEGEQSPDHYKKAFDKNANPAWINMDWSIVSPIPKIVNIIEDKFAEMGDMMMAAAIDSTAREKYRDDRAWMEAEIALKEFLTPLDVMGGKSTKTPQRGFVPESSDEIDIFFKTGYKQQIEFFCEEALAWLAYDNNWDSEVKEDIIHALVVDGIAGTRDYRDENGKIRCRSLDMLTTMFSFSRHKNFRDVQRAGEYVRLTIGELRKRAGNQFTPEQYRDIADKFRGKYGNPSVLPTEYYMNDVFGDTPYDHFTIEVLDGAFRSTNRIVYEKKLNEFGEARLHKRHVGYVVPKDAQDKRSTLTKDVEVYYEGCWIVGSDYMYNFRLGTDMRRDKTTKGQYESSVDKQFPFRFYRPNNKSIVERLIPHENQLMLNWLKLQNAVARAKPKGIKIELSSLEGITIDGENWTPLQVLEMYDQRGDVIYRVGDDWPQGFNKSPIEELENGLGRDVLQYVDMINFQVDQMRLVSGINEFVDASTPDPNQPVRNAQLAAQSSNNALGSIKKGYKDLKERTLKGMLCRLQIDVRNGDIDSYVNVFGSNKLRPIKVNSDIAWHDFGIKIEDRPSQEKKASLQADIQNALKTGMIDLSDSFAVEDVMESSIKLAQQLLVVRQDKKMKAMEQAKQADMQANAQAQQESNQQTAENKISELGMQAELEERKMKLQHELDKKLDDHQTENKIKVINEEKIIEVAQQDHLSQTESENERQGQLLTPTKK